MPTLQEAEYELARAAVEPFVWLELTIRPPVIERSLPLSGKTKILLAGGTPFSRLDEDVRIGHYSIRDVSNFFAEKLPEYKAIIDPDEVLIYPGLSEDITSRDLDNIEVNTVGAINNSPDINSFIMFIGSDRTEDIGFYLHNNLSAELKRHNIKIFLVWANNPVPDPEVLIHCERALRASREDLEGGVYMVSGTSIFPVIYAEKETWDGKPMKYFNIEDKHAANEEWGRRNKIVNLADRLSTNLFFHEFGS